MFTGIVEELGTIQHIARGQHSAVLTIQAKTVLEHTKLGDSIAVNGICLTVTQLHADRFSADVMHETLNRSALAQLSVGSPVTLETDIIGKYIEKLLQPAAPQPKESTITRDLLSRCGF